MSSMVFVNPPLTLEERYGNLAEGGSLAPPQGLCNLAAVTRENDFKTYIVDSAALGLSYDETVKEVLTHSPDYVGITAVTISIYNAAKVAKMLKSVDRDIPVIIGGPHVTAVPEETLERFPEFDIGVVGEGEVTLMELLKGIEEGKELRGIDGLVTRDKGSIKVTQSRELIKDLDALPLPAWDLLPDLRKYYRPPAFSFNKLPSTSLITSRGCPGQCTFCDRSVFGNKVRAYSAEYVIDMITHLVENYGIRDIIVDDDNFMLFKPRMRDICNKLIENDFDLTWSCNSRVDIVDPDILSLARKAGCWQIAYGIESGSQEILNLIKKKITLSKIKTTLKWTKKAGIKTKGFFMIGHPTETKETIRATIDFAKSADLDDFQMSMFTPFPKTEIYRNAEKYGKLDRNWKQMNGWYPVFIPNDLTKEELIRYSKAAIREFYLRPKIIISYLKMCTNPSCLPKIFKGCQVILKSLA